MMLKTGHRQQGRLSTAEMNVQGGLGRHSCRPGYGHGYAQNGIGPQFALIVGAVDFQHFAVYGGLLGGIHPFNGGGNGIVHVGHCGQDSLTAVAGLVFRPLSSSASRIPVDGPPMAPPLFPSRPSSRGGDIDFKTVGLPRESRISLA